MSEEQQEEFEFEYHDDGDYIQSAYFAMSVIDDVDMEMASPTMRARIKRIKRNAIKIVDHCLNNLYNQLFDTDEE